MNPAKKYLLSLLTVVICIVAWEAIASALSGRPESVFVALLASVILTVTLRYLSRAALEWLNPGPLRTAAWLFALMSFVSFGAFALSFALAAPDIHLFASWTVQQILDFKLWLLEDEQVKKIVSWGLIVGSWGGAAIFLLAITGLDMLRVLVRKFSSSLGVLIQTFVVLVVCVSSFSIVAGSASADLVKATETELAAELRDINDAIERKEAWARVVFGESLVSKIREIKPAFVPLLKQELERSCREMLEASSDCSIQTLEQEISNKEAALAALTPTAPSGPGSGGGNGGAGGGGPKSPDSPVQKPGPSGRDLSPERIERFKNVKSRDVRRQSEEEERHWDGEDRRSDAIDVLIEFAMAQAGLGDFSGLVPEWLSKYSKTLVEKGLIQPFSKEIRSFVTEYALRCTEGLCVLSKSGAETLDSIRYRFLSMAGEFLGILRQRSSVLKSQIATASSPRVVPREVGPIRSPPRPSTSIEVCVWVCELNGMELWREERSCKAGPPTRPCR